MLPDHAGRAGPCRPAGGPATGGPRWGRLASRAPADGAPEPGRRPRTASARKPSWRSAPSWGDPWPGFWTVAASVLDVPCQSAAVDGARASAGSAGGLLEVDGDALDAERLGERGQHLAGVRLGAVQHVAVRRGGAQPALGQRVEVAVVVRVLAEGVADPLDQSAVT